ncbi:MAG: hypothetical protein KDD37_09770, partial [Bdellovibrionales bacterium]|nr:hypothetical protein [Bdellovibrionales bacterium]
MKTLLYIILSFFVFATSSYAQQKKSKKTVINFDDELVEGDVSKPELSYLLQKKQFNFGKLI